MRLRFSILGALVAALCMSGIATAGASAEEFGASSTGGLLSEGTTEQVFTVKNGTETLRVECEKVKNSGEVKSTKTQTQIVAVEYTECFTAGNKIKPIKAEYEFNAGTEKVPKGPAKGTVKVLKAVSVETESAGICKLTVPAQGPLSGITFSENTKHNKGLTIAASVTGITSESASGTLAPCKYASNKEGTYTGSAEAWLNVTGGELSLLE